MLLSAFLFPAVDVPTYSLHPVRDCCPGVVTGPGFDLPRGFNPVSARRSVVIAIMQPVVAADRRGRGGCGWLKYCR